MNRAPAIRTPQSIALMLLLLSAFTRIIPAGWAQTTERSAPPSQSVPPNQPSPEPPASPPGKVLFLRDLTGSPDSTKPDAQPTATQPRPSTDTDTFAVTDAERSALTFTDYDLDVHLAPATAAISVRAGLNVRNDSASPLDRLVLQLSSSLHWDAISTRPSAIAALPLVFATHLVDTDADHTGQMSETVVKLPQPLASGASITLTALYSGTIPASAQRLERIGAPADQALATDWDSIAGANPDGQTGGTALRGFGNVLWYPVSAPPISLGEGGKFFQTVGEQKLRESAATVRLRLAVEYTGDSPDAAFFCGRREHLKATSDNPNLPVAESAGVATALFPAQTLGFRTLNLFLSAAAASNTGTVANSDLIAAVTGHSDALPAYSAAATQVEPLLTDWLGPQPLTPLTILDHAGQPFEDDALLVRPMRAVDAATLVPSLVHSLTHAWIHSNRAWIDEGLAQFTSLLWTERTAGRPAALAQLEDAARSLALFEPAIPTSGLDSTSSSFTTPNSQASSSDDASHLATASPLVSPAGTSLADATGEIFYRTKAAAVWWMLRTLVGDDALKQCLQAYRLDGKLDHDPAGLEHTLEKFSHQDLRWFFNDWVYRDRGLPDLSIVSVTPSQLEIHNGQPAAWLVAVVVRNDGYAEADVPVTVRSATSSETRRLRIPGQLSMSTRILFAGAPDQVQVNDGGVPEIQASIHTRRLVLPGR